MFDRQNWTNAFAIVVVAILVLDAQGQTMPGGSASKPGGTPGDGGGSDDNQECVYYGIPPEFDVRRGRGIFFELWFGGSHVYDYDYVNKVAYPTDFHSVFGPNPVGVADLSALLAQAHKPRPKPYTGPKMIAPLDASTAAFFERVSEREARVEFAVNTFYEVAVTIQEVATKRSRPRPRPRPPHRNELFRIQKQLSAGSESRFPGTSPSFTKLRQADATVSDIPEHGGSYAVRIPKEYPKSARIDNISIPFVRQIESAGNNVRDLLFQAPLAPTHVTVLRRQGLTPRPKRPLGINRDEKLLDSLGMIHFEGVRVYVWSFGPGHDDYRLDF